MGSSVRAVLALCVALLAGASLASAQVDGAQWLDVEFPRDSPVLPVSFSLRPSTARATGSSTVLDLHASLLLRNTATKSITGMTLRIEAPDLASAGKASLTVPSLHVQPGEVFPLKIDVELRRPSADLLTQGAVVQVRLDCALFKDLTAYGPDKLNSRRTLTIYELQARREREYVTGLLHAGRLAEIREELNFGLQDLRPPALGLELSRRAAATQRQTTANLETMRFASSPVTATGGSVRIANGDVLAPHLNVKNESQKTVRSIEVGWIVRDEQGREYLAGSMPMVMRLNPVGTGSLDEASTIHFYQAAGQPVAMSSLTAYVSDVEFMDGNHWIPSRADIASATKNPALRRALFDSPEQQRLSEIYRRKGISGLTSELKRAD